MLDLLMQSFAIKATFATARIGVPDQLRSGPVSIEALSNATGTHAPSLYRVLRALASVGIYRELADGRFALTRASQALRSDHPTSIRDLCVMAAEPWHEQMWIEMVHALKTGRSAFVQAHGEPVFEYLQRNPEAGAVFDRAMTAQSRAHSAAIAAAYPTDKVSTLADIGGGRGQLLSALLVRNPELRGTLFDQPSAVQEAQTTLADAGVQTRCELISGSFFDSVPAGADVYMLKHIIHDWNDDAALAILRNCYRAMKPTSKLVLIEAIVPPGNQPSFSKLTDLEMLVLTDGGRERTKTEFVSLLSRAGFSLHRVLPTGSTLSLLEFTRIWPFEGTCLMAWR